MKKILLIFFFIPIAIGSALAQAPLVKKWDYRYGGGDIEWLNSLLPTNDNGCIIGGRSFSNISGDKTQNLCIGTFTDIWIVKLDSAGIKQWDKDFGGDGWEDVFSILQTADGGYLLGGFSGSGISCDKTEALWGFDDYWIIKIDSLGNKQWDKDYGGFNMEVFTSMNQTHDGGFILGGYSNSGTGGNKTDSTWGGLDYWIVKIDSLGNKEWDKDIGGTRDDYLYSVRQTYDGGYILGGYTDSDIGGDKTENSWSSSVDYWIVKTDSLGNKVWDRNFGGIYNDRLLVLELTSDGGFILGGLTRSGISGNKTSSLHGIPGFDFDFWIIKTDSSGTKDWDVDFGGADADDDFNSITLTSDSNYLITGTSYSNVSGDKTESNLGQEQTWALKIDSLGNKLWDKTIFTPCQDEVGYGIETKDGCYVFANVGASGCGAGGYRTQGSVNNSSDFWVVKLCETLKAYFTSPSLICPGSCIDFTNLSFLATSYQWHFYGAIPDTSTATNPTNICYATPGSYDVQLIASNASGSDTLLLPNYITVYPIPQPQSITQYGDTLFAIAGAGTYQWYFNGTIINGATDYFCVATASGDYNVVVSDANGCEVEAVINDVLAHTPLAVGFLSFAIYPNPVEDKCTIQNAQFTMRTAIEVVVYNVLGEKTELAFYKNTDRGMLTMDCRLLLPGMYSIEITSGENIYRAKFVKQ